MPNPIDKRQRERLAGCRRLFRIVIDALERMKRAGIPCESQEEVTAYLYDMLRRYEGAYVGTQPDTSGDARILPHGPYVPIEDGRGGRSDGTVRGGPPGGDFVVGPPPGMPIPPGYVGPPVEAECPHARSHGPPVGYTIDSKGRRQCCHGKPNNSYYIDPENGVMIPCQPLGPPVHA